MGSTTSLGKRPKERMISYGTRSPKRRPSFVKSARITRHPSSGMSSGNGTLPARGIQVTMQKTPLLVKTMRPICL